MKEELLDFFDYDGWANDRWLEVLPHAPFQKDGMDILRHVWSAQSYWFSVTFGDEGLPARTDDLAADFSSLRAAWKDWFANCDPTAFTAVERDGKTYFFMVQDILRHVLNHGTYHRGELRGLARAHQFADFPETDFSRYMREQQI